MKPALAWVRANPLTVGAAAVAMASLVCLFIIHSQGRDFVDAMARREAEIHRVRALRQTMVKIPPAKPDDPERELKIAVNQAAIDQLGRVYDRMNEEYREIFKLAVEINQNDHRPILEGLFPKPVDAGKPYQAKEVYRGIFVEMLERHSAGADYPRLNAGPPPSRQQIDAQVKRIDSGYLENSLFPPKKSIDELTDDEADELDRIRAEKLIEFFQEHARTIHLYADPDMGSPDFAFDVGRWSEPGPGSPMHEIWEGQLGLWIQRDIAEAISLTNHADDPGSSVMDAPIKRLIQVRVVPGYVGVGGARGGLGTPSAGEPARLGSVISSDGAAGGPPGGDAGAQLPDDFSVSPSGRSSNVMYDVRHVRVSLVLDSQRVPEFFENLQRVNFMAVLKMEISAIDEYGALRQGYVYGAGDSVRADMLIETIWLRDWTTQYMPRTIRNLLSIRNPDGGDVPEADSVAPALQ